MPLSYWVLLVLTFLAATGCTRSRESSENTTTSENPPPRSAPQIPAAKPDDRPLIVAFGDSLAEGFGAETGASFPDQLQRRLDKSPYRYRVVNLGVSGDTSTGGMGRLSYAISLKPEIVILELGGNDGLRGIPVSSTKANLEQMIIGFQKAGASVLLAGMTLPPNYGPDYIRQFESAYKDLAAKYKLHLIPFLMQDILAQYASHPELMQRDGIHPTAAGHAVIADTVFRNLQPMLKAQ